MITIFGKSKENQAKAKSTREHLESKAEGYVLDGKPVSKDEFMAATTPPPTAAVPAPKPVVAKQPTVIHRADSGGTKAVPTPEKTLARAEWKNLSVGEQARFFAGGGKLSDPCMLPEQFLKKPDFSSLHGVERVSASFKWSNGRKAALVEEATFQIEAEDIAKLPVKNYGEISPASIAEAMLDAQQARASKTEPSAWSKEASAKKERIAARVKLIEAKYPA